MHIIQCLHKRTLCHRIFSTHATLGCACSFVRSFDRSFAHSQVPTQFVVVVVQLFAKNVFLARCMYECWYVVFFLLNAFSLLCSVYFASVSQSPYLFNVTAVGGKCCFHITFRNLTQTRELYAYFHTYIKPYTQCQCMRMPTQLTRSFIHLLSLIHSFIYGLSFRSTNSTNVRILKCK